MVRKNMVTERLVSTSDMAKILTARLRINIPVLAIRYALRKNRIRLPNMLKIGPAFVWTEPMIDCVEMYFREEWGIR